MEMSGRVTALRSIDWLAKEIFMIKPWIYQDTISGNEIEVSVSNLYTTLRINNRHYYFYAEDGKFDGTSTDWTIKPSSAPLPIYAQRLQ